jgi:hypothetical protein
MKNLKYIYWALLCTTLSFASFAGDSEIPLDSKLRIPSDDLSYQGSILTSLEAKGLQDSATINLSDLDPNNNEIYDGVDHSHQSNLDTHEIDNNSEVQFLGALSSNSGLLRFNAVGSENTIFTIHLDKTLHSLLLRKNLLEKCGFIIPEMKYFKKIKVHFESEELKTNFIKTIIPENTLGASDRWITEQDSLNVTLQDVVLTIPSETDFYNVAMGIPTDVINSRTLRSLALFYNVVNLEESVNQFSWVSAKIDNKALVLNHFTGNSFNSSIDDILWGLKKLNKLKREDIKLIVENSFFPSGVKEVLVEKIISRISALNKLLNLKDYKLAFNSKINVDNLVVEGRINITKFEGFASRFAYGEAETPFDQLRYYLYSKLQSNVIDNAISYLNKNMEGYDLSAKRTAYFQDQFKTGLQHFIDTGELLPITVGTWSSPVANAQLILSRDIVIGNYLGTDNLVQLADTVGAGIDLGAALGIEGLDYGMSAVAKASVSLVRTYAHLKPVKSLKSSLKEPYKNLFVNLLKKSLKEKFYSLSELKNFNGSNDEKNKKIQELFKEIDSKLGVGESLILTDRIMPSASVSLNYSQGIVGTGIGASGAVNIIKRIHFYKKAPSILQIFDDKGHSRSIDLSFHINTLGISTLKLSQSFDKGAYNVKSYMVNLNESLDENPNLFQNALGIYEVLKSKNFEILNSSMTPVDINANFTDKTTSFSFLLWKAKKVKGKTYYDVKARDGVNGKFFSYQKDFLTGANVESLSKKLLNYYLQDQVTKDVSITDEDGKNPGDTFYGKAHTETFRFEASFNESSKLEKKFLTMSDVRSGWTMSEKSLNKFIQNINSKFNTYLFDQKQIDFTNLKMYKIGYHLNLYEAGIQKLSQLTNADVQILEVKYQAQSRCLDEDPKLHTPECGDLTMLKQKVKRCSKLEIGTDETDKAVCLTELFERLYSDIKFDDFKVIVGANNFYLYGSIDGFRKHSEVLNDTIYSNSIGKIGSNLWNGPFETVRSLVGLSDGEFSASWLREGI